MRNVSLRCLLLFVIVPAAFGHEIGTTRVHARLQRDHTYQIDVITAPQALLNKLEARAHQTPSRNLAPAELQKRLTVFTPALLEAADIRFGTLRSVARMTILPIAGDPANTPTVSPADDGAQPLHVTVRYSGEIPPRAAAFSWSWGLVYSTYALTIDTPAAKRHEQWIDADGRSTPFPVDAAIAAPTTLDVLRQYLILGFTHIVPLGLDHILFVIGMFLLTPKVKAVLTQVTAFTIAHTITLAVTMYGLVSVSPRIVEPLIALSIAYVAIENLTTTHLRPWRVAIVFAFGLLHGMGFAGVLQELGLPRSQAAFALISFNIGVELGQLSVIAAMYLLVVSWAQRRPWFRPRFVVPASLAIAAMGLMWMVERVSA